MLTQVSLAPSSREDKYDDFSATRETSCTNLIALLMNLWGSLVLRGWRSGTSAVPGDPTRYQGVWLLFSLSYFMLILHITDMECTLLICFKAAVGKLFGHIDF